MNTPELDAAAGRRQLELVQDERAAVGGRHPPLGDQLVADGVDRVKGEGQVGEGGFRPRRSAARSSREVTSSTGDQPETSSV
jgi:hypothetical protein